MRRLFPVAATFEKGTADIEGAGADGWSNVGNRVAEGIGSDAAADPDGFEGVEVHPIHAEDGGFSLSFFIHVAKGATWAIEECDLSQAHKRTALRAIGTREANSHWCVGKPRRINWRSRGTTEKACPTRSYRYCDADSAGESKLTVRKGGSLRIRTSALGVHARLQTQTRAAFAARRASRLNASHARLPSKSGGLARRRKVHCPVK